MRKFVITLVSAASFAGGAISPAGAGLEPFIGEITFVPYTFCPKGWLPAQGQLLPIIQYDALFSLIGWRYGGNGSTTFALPNISPVPTLTPGAVVTACIALQGIFPSQP